VNDAVSVLQRRVRRADAGEQKCSRRRAERDPSAPPTRQNFKSTSTFAITFAMGPSAGATYRPLSPRRVR
jgi:hypothetical protein